MVRGGVRTLTSFTVRPRIFHGVSTVYILLFDKEDAYRAAMSRFPMKGQEKSGGKMYINDERDEEGRGGEGVTAIVTGGW